MVILITTETMSRAGLPHFLVSREKNRKSSTKLFCSNEQRMRAVLLEQFVRWISNISSRVFRKSYNFFRIQL